jgi:hypothetical protein
MTDWLLSIGFTHAGHCNCNGQKNHKFKRGEWLIYVTSTQFKVKKNGSTVKGYASIEGLKKYVQAALPQLFTGGKVPDHSGV